MQEPRSTLALAATFAAAPLVEAARFWMQESGIACHLLTAPPDQVLDHVREPEGLLRGNTAGVNALVVRFSDLSERGERVPEWIDRIADSLHSAGAFEPQTTIILRCAEQPNSVHAPAGIAWERRLSRAVANLAHVRVVTEDEMAAECPVRVFAGSGPRAPYTAQYLAAVGTLLVRRAHAARRAPYQVLALACDGVLWKGLCGEVAPNALEVDAPRRALQEFAVARAGEGWKVCLSSTNDPADVQRVFAARPDMPLSSAHLTASRMDWSPASERLASLARDLRVAESSIVSLHACQLECAEVRAHSPGVIALSLPEDDERIPRFLRGVWAFDPPGHARKDVVGPPSRPRPAPAGRPLGRPVRHRESVDISPAASQDFAALAGVARRARHFNATGGCVSAAELEWFARLPGREVLAVSLPELSADGPIGALRLRRVGDVLRVEDWWLRESSLGRGVEGHVMRVLGRRAVAAGASALEVAHVPSRRNEPVRRYLESIGARRSANDYAVPIWAALGAAAALTREMPQASDCTGDAPFHQRAAGALGTPAGVLRATARSLKGTRRGAPPYRLPRTETERWMSATWRTVLGVDRVGSQDNFFDLGGDSLAGARVMARVRSAFGVEIPLADLFDAPTLEAQAGRLVTARLAQADPSLVRSLLDAQPALVEVA